jgi:hypothetical protein
MGVYQGSPTIDERIGAETLVIKKALRNAVYDLRVAMPGIIRTFDPVTQFCTIDLTVADKQYINNAWEDVVIPTLQDVQLLLPGDANWAITFPSPVGAECLVIAADFCINAWATTGQIPSNQELDRRHDYSDPFAILAPRSIPKAIPNYSMSQMQLRSMDGVTAISLDENITLKATDLIIDGPIVAATAPSYPTFSMPVTINGVLYYMQLKATP